MIIRRDDFGSIEQLKPNSRKDIWFICEKCGCGYRQGYSTYLKQSPGKLCYLCRRKEIASRKEVKEKQSIGSKNTWKNPDYKEKMSKMSSETQKRRWENTPKEERNKNRIIPYEEYTTRFNFKDFTLLSTKEEYEKGIIKYTCPEGHLNEGKFALTKEFPPCKTCKVINVEKIKEELKELGHELIDFDTSNQWHKMTIKCEKGHMFTKNYANWKINKNCSVCTGRQSDLTEIKEDFEKEGYEIINDNNFHGTTKSHEFTLKCSRGHIFNMSYYNFKNGSKCEECNKIEKYEEYKKRVEEKRFKLLDTLNEFYEHRDYFNFECDQGHIHSMFWTNFANNQGCGQCAAVLTVSNPEYELRNVFDLYNIEYNTSNREILGGKELDLYFPKYNLAIEFNGYPWHTELHGKDKKYHVGKTNECEKNGIQLIHIFYDEWELKRELIIKKLLHIFNKSQEERIYARKCIIKEIETKEAKEFCEIYHLQKYGRAAIRLGLFYNNELVSVMTFSKGNIAKGNKAKENEWELNRYCTSSIVIGGATKLLEYFKKNFIWNKIFTYADRRWSNGNLYYKMGFNFIKNTEPNYWYIHPKNCLERLYRFNFRRSKLEGEGTEWEIMKRNGYNRIWDCGHMLFEIEK